MGRKLFLSSSLGFAFVFFSPPSIRRARAIRRWMAGVRWPPEDSDLPPPRVPAATAAAAAAAAAEMISDDDRSVAADSWSIKSEYGSTLDDEQRHVDAAEVLLGCNFPATASDYRFTRYPFLGFCFVFSCSAMVVGLASVASLRCRGS